VTLDADIEQLFLEHVARLQVRLEQMSGGSSGLEEGSDAWLLLHMLTENDQQDRQALSERFEHAGRVLAEQDGRIESRLKCLQEYTNALIAECQVILQDNPKLLVEATKRS